MVASDEARVELVVYTPMTLVPPVEGAPAYIYAHYGGAVAYSARDCNNIMAVAAHNLNCIIVSVDFRNGPEVKCPRGQQDFVDAIMHIIKNSEKFSINPE